MLIGELECLYEAQSLVDRTSHRKIIDCYLAQNAVLVDDEQSTEGDAALLVEHPVAPGDAHGLVGQQGDAHLAEAPLLARGVDPRQVREVAVGGRGNHGRLDFLELLRTIGERDDLSRAHKSTGIGNLHIIWR